MEQQAESGATLPMESGVPHTSIDLANSLADDPEKNAQVSVPESEEDPLQWDTAPENPLNWPSRKKVILMAAISASAISAYVF